MESVVATNKQKQSEAAAAQTKVVDHKVAGGQSPTPQCANVETVAHPNLPEGGETQNGKDA